MTSYISQIERRQHVCVAVFAGLSALSCAIFIALVVMSSGHMSGYDFLDWIMQDGARAGGWIAYLWTPHNEHRIAADRLLVALDIAWFDGRGWPFVVVRTTLWLGMAGALMREVATTTLPPASRTVLTAALGFVLLPSGLVVMCSMPLMGGFIHSCAFTVLALLLWDNNGAAWQSLALVSAAVAGLGVAGGLFVWPVLLYAIWRSRGSAWSLVIVGAVGLVVCGVYLNDLPAHARMQGFDIGRVVASIDFVLRFLGLPWSHAPSLVWFGRAVGAAVLGIGSWLILADAWSRAEQPKIMRLGIAMLQFALITALAAAASRWDVATDREMPIRYGVIVALAHAGLLLAAAPWIIRRVEHRSASIIRIGLAGIALVLLLQQIMVGRAALAQVDLYASAWSRFAAGEWSSDMAQYVYPDRARAEQILAYMKSRHIYGQ